MHLFCTLFLLSSPNRVEIRPKFLSDHFGAVQGRKRSGPDHFPLLFGGPAGRFFLLLVQNTAFLFCSGSKAVKMLKILMSLWFRKGVTSPSTGHVSVIINFLTISVFLR